MKCEEVKLKNAYNDHVWVELKMKSKETLLCGCIYRSPNKDRTNTIDTTIAVCNIIEEAAERKDTYLLICGDFNYPDIDWENEHIEETTPVIRPFIETFQNCYLHQHITQQTRYRSDPDPSLLDLIFTNEEGLLNELVHNPGIGESDHECLGFHLNCYKNEIDKSFLPNYHKGDYAKIRTRLRPIDWVEKLQGDFLTSYSTFLETMENAIENCIPKRANSKERKNIYFTPDAMRRKDLKNRLWRKYKRTKSGYDRM